MREISDVSSGQSPYTPATSVRYTSFSASSASAIAPATVSALMLYAWPASSTPIVAMTGISSSRSSRSTIVGSIVAHVADEAEARVALVDPDEAGVLAREPDRVRAVLVDRRDDLAVDLADERHAHDVDGLGVGDPQAVDELGLLAEPAHEVGDLRTAAVHDDRVHADQPHEHDVLREQVGERGILHRVAAVLDDDGLARELADVRQRLGEDRRLLPRVARRSTGVDRVTTCAGSRRCTRARGRW